MKKILIVLVVLLSTELTYAQNFLPNKEAVTKHTENVMKYLEASEIPKAFSELQEYWPLPENEIIQLESQTIKQFNLVGSRFGNISGYDFIKDDGLKDYVIRKTYVIKFELHMIRVLFTYYKNEKGWILNSFKWDDQFEELLN